MQLGGDLCPLLGVYHTFLLGRKNLTRNGEDMNVAELIQALSEMPQDMPVHFWANGERQTIIEVSNVGDCIDLYEEEAP
jgi:hypothetical protein